MASIIYRPFTPKDGGCIPAYVPSQLSAQVFFYQGVLNHCSQTSLGELGKNWITLIQMGHPVSLQSRRLHADLECSAIRVSKSWYSDIS
jgi:hypothetical protein